MRIIFDKSVPVGVRRFLSAHEVHTFVEMEWRPQLENGELLSARELSQSHVIRTSKACGFGCIYTITRVLFEDRHEIAEAIPKEVTSVKFLLADVKQGDTLGGLAPPVHPGAQRFFDRDKPSFVLEHASFLGLIVTLVVIVFSWLRELKRRMEKRRKNEGNRYTEEVIQLLQIGQRSNSRIALEAVRSQLVIILTEAVKSLDLDKISENAFLNFRGVWQIALDLVREREAALDQKEEEIKETLSSQAAEKG